MIKNKIYIFFSLIVLLFILSLTYLTFDSNLRRSVYSKSIGAYKLYQYHIISSHVFYKDFNSASKQILKYIEFSQKISEGKNSMLQGIVDVTELATSKAYSQDEFNIMEKVYIKINELSDDIYKNHVWLARSISDDDLDKSVFHLKKALRLSNSSEQAYREIIRLFPENYEMTNLMSDYCKNYFTSTEGSIKKRMGAHDENKFFYGTNSILAISRGDNFSTVNQRLINKNLNRYHNYDFLFEKSEDVKQFNILKNFFAGSKISIKNIILYNEQQNRINLEDLIIHSLSSYILDQSNEEIVFLNTNDDDDILKFNFNKIYKDINRITLDLKLEKLSLVNKSTCKRLYEN